jgi:hypothetical protein
LTTITTTTIAGEVSGHSTGVRIPIAARSTPRVVASSALWRSRWLFGFLIRFAYRSVLVWRFVLFVRADHTEKTTMWTLLDVKAQTGIELTDSMAM